MDDIRVLLFFYFGEAVLLFYTGLAMFELKLSIPRLLCVAGLYSLCIWFVRGLYAMYNIPLGTHTLILVVLSILLMKFIGKVDWIFSVGAVLTGFSLILIGNWFINLIIQQINLTWEHILGSVWLHILFGYLEDTFLILLLVLNKIFGLSYIKLFELE